MVEQEETYNNASQVKCVLAARQKNKRGMLETFVSNTSYSHHQKTGDFITINISTLITSSVLYLAGFYTLTCGLVKSETLRLNGKI